MIDFSNIPLMSSWILDVILILISASACFYCAMLSRRLKALNALDGGVGASIVSLTEAIGKTHDAAREAQSATHETVETLRFLLKKCESMAPNIEASIAELEGALKNARQCKAEMEGGVTADIEEATAKARSTAANLVKIVKAVDAHYIKQDKKAEALEKAAAAPQAEAAIASAPTPQAAASAAVKVKSVTPVKSPKKEAAQKPKLNPLSAPLGAANLAFTTHEKAVH